MNKFEYYKRAIKKYANFEGRASRPEYWYFVLFNVIISIALGIIGGRHHTLENLYALFILIPGITVSVRRLHDIGKSGWMLLISLIPIIGTIWIIVLLATEGEYKENKYGHQPKK